MTDIKFSDEYEYLIYLIRSAVQETEPQDIPEQLSFEKVLEYGIMHEVANIAFLAVKRLKTLPEDDIFNRWQQEYFKAVRRDMLQKKAREEVISALHSNGIYTLEVQGTVVKKYYPQSHLRMMSDIDFIIPVKKLDDSKLVMQSIGYTADNPYGLGINASKNMINIELHTRFFTTQNADLNPMNFPYSFAVCGENFTATVTDTIFYLYHLLHTIKHFKYQGLGIRRIVDLYYLENALKDKVDYDYIDSFLKKYGLYEAKLQLLAVKNYWFYGIKPKADILEIQKYILESGTHGTLENYYKNMFLKERAKGKHFVKIRYLLEFLFPKKEYLYNAFPVCKKYRLPVVVCWLYRGIRIFKPEKFKSFKFVLSNLKIKIKRSK